MQVDIGDSVERRAASAACTPTPLLVAAGLKRQRLSAGSTREPGPVAVESQKWHREADVLARRHFTTQSCLRFVGPDGRAAETAAREHWGSVLTLLPVGVGMQVAYIDAPHSTPFWTLLVADDMDVKAAGVHLRPALFVILVFSPVLRVPPFWTKIKMNTVGTFGIRSAYYWGLGEKVSGREHLEAKADQMKKGELYLDRLTDLVSRAEGGSENRVPLRPRSRLCLKLSPCLMAMLLPFLLHTEMTTGIRPISGATCVFRGRVHWCCRFPFRWLCRCDAPRD